MNLSRFRLITFDVTNTLLQFRSSPGKQYGEIGAMYGVLCDNHSLTTNFKTHWHKMSKEHPNFGRSSGLGWEKWWKMVVYGTFKDSKFNLDDRKLEAIATHLIEAYQTSLCWQQSYGALGLLSYLRNRGVPIGIISNFDPRLDSTLINTRLRHYFRFVLTSYEAEVEKPHPDIFTKALEKSQIDRLKPDECLHVGDEVVLDYLGAKESGWNAVLVKDKNFDDIRQKHPDVDGKEHFTTLYDFHRQLVDNTGEKISAQTF